MRTCKKLEVATTAWRNKLTFLQSNSIKHSRKSQKWVVSSAGFDVAHVLPCLCAARDEPYLYFTAMVTIAEPLHEMNAG
jgi:hypothetical protein